MCMLEENEGQKVINRTNDDQILWYCIMCGVTGPQ